VESLGSIKCGCAVEPMAVPFELLVLVVALRMIWISGLGNALVRSKNSDAALMV